MLIPLKDIVQKYNLNVKGVIQVGAHWAEEHEVYMQLGINNIIYVEPCKSAYEVLQHKFRITSKWWTQNMSIILCQCACGEEEGEFGMYVSNNNQGQSNSLLKPSLHLKQHPEVVFTEYEIVKVVPLDKLPFRREYYNLLVMDVQGAEGMVLKGAKETLKHIDVIYTECNSAQTYEGNMEIDEMDAFLFGYGFIRKETVWPSKNWTWGDAVYIKNDHPYISARDVYKRETGEEL